MRNKIELSTPHFERKEFDFIGNIFKSENISLLDNITEFETQIERYLDDNVAVVALNSGTAALHLALLLLGVKANDEVLCQSMTFVASANAIRYLGATPIFIDSEKETWNLCPEILERAILDRIAKTKKPKAIIAVHLFGMPYKVDEIHSVARKYEIVVIEDSAEAFGSSYKGKKCGTFGDLGVLSFNNNKIITTTGGGAIVCHSEAIYNKAIFFATQAKDVALHYEHSEIGYNYRMSPICAGIGVIQMKVLEERLRARRAMHKFYTHLFAKIEGVAVFHESSKDYYSSHWLSALTINPIKVNGKTAQQMHLHLKEANIESRLLWKPMHLQPAYLSFPYYGGCVAEELFKNGLCLPSSSNLTDNDRNRITEAIHQFFK